MRISLVVKLIILSVLGVYIFQNWSGLTNLFQRIYYSPCDFPIRYKIGSIDPQFKLSTEKVRSNIANAEAIWENATGKNLFISDPAGKLTINLTFDKRQSLKNEISDLRSDLDDQKNNFDPSVAKYEADVERFKKDVAALNEEIKSWNDKGGAPKEEYEKLKKRQLELQAEMSRLNQEAKQLNQSAASFNQSVKELNQTIDQFNQDLKERPEEGLYSSKEERIDIYLVDTEEELIHTLAHEMGHALGLDHNNNPKSIMYSFTSRFTTPTGEDIADLTNLCKKRTILEDIAERFRLLLTYLKQYYAT